MLFNVPCEYSETSNESRVLTTIREISEESAREELGKIEWNDEVTI